MVCSSSIQVAPAWLKIIATRTNTSSPVFPRRRSTALNMRHARHFFRYVQQVQKSDVRAREHPAGQTHWRHEFAAARVPVDTELARRG